MTLDVGKRSIVIPRSAQNFYSDIIKTGTDIDLYNEHVTAWFSSAFVLRDPLDRVIPDQSRKFNIAAACYGFLRCIVKTDLKFFNQLIPNPKSNRLEDHLVPVPTDFLNSPDDFHSLTDSFIEVLSDVEDINLASTEFSTFFELSDIYLTMVDNELHVQLNFGKLDLWRQYPYELFVSSMLQEWIAHRSISNIGTHTTIANLGYIMTNDRVTINAMSRTRWGYKMDAMPDFISKETVAAIQDMALDMSWDVYNKYRQQLELKEDFELHYFVDLFSVCHAFANRKTDFSKSQLAYKSIKDQTLKHTLRPWLF